MSSMRKPRRHIQKSLLMISDVKLALYAPLSLHTRWAREQDADTPRCMCDQCKESRRKWWNNIDLIEFDSQKHVELRWQEKINNRLYRSRKPRKCPNCDEASVVEIIGGYPGPELWKLEQQGKIILGGCDHLPGLDASWECTKCHQQIWDSREECFLDKSSSLKAHDNFPKMVQRIREGATSLELIEMVADSPGDKEILGNSKIVLKVIEMVTDWPKDRQIPQKLKAAFDKAKGKEKSFVGEIARVLITSTKDKRDIELFLQHFGSSGSN